MRAAISAEEAARLVPDGASVMIGGFLAVGSPRRIIDAQVARGARGLPELTLQPASARPATLVVTDLAVIEPTPEGLVLREGAPGVTAERILAATAAPLHLPERVPEMRLAPDGTGSAGAAGRPDDLTRKDQP